MRIEIANEVDIPELVSIMDKSYRGEASKQGWTSEADLFIGTKRTDESTVKELMQRPGAVFLKCVNEEELIIACVLLNKKNNRIYLGMFSVLPEAQGKGIGKKLLEASENYAKEKQCISIFMTVISIRHELISWYEKYGYGNTGRVLPFPQDDRFGIPKQPLEMLVLEKML